LYNNGYEVSIYINNYFSPLLVVIAIAYNQEIMPVVGMGCSLNINQAIDKSLSELYLLMSERDLRDCPTRRRFL
jgi:hypothetical protein